MPLISACCFSMDIFLYLFLLVLCGLMVDHSSMSTFKIVVVEVCSLKENYQSRLAVGEGSRAAARS